VSCRHCGASLELTLVDLGTAPPSNAYLTVEELALPELFIPLRVLVCEQCWLAQTDGFANASELFDADYAYFSSFSSTWLDHAERFVDEAVRRFGLDASSHVVEVAANDGYLLQFIHARGIPCTGVEPTASTAAVAREKGIPVVEDFFGTGLARKLASVRRADFIIANNVLAHVPDINDFTAGFAALLQPDGVASFEFPHLMSLIAENQFDTVYHEHYSYLSLTAVNTIFRANGLEVFDVQQLPTHGGSLRVIAQPVDSGTRARESTVDELLEREKRAGMKTPAYYAGCQAKAERVKNEFLGFLLEARRNGMSVAAYGAAAKGNTLLNFAGVRSDLIRFVVDANPAKQGRVMPGSRIPIVAEDRLRGDKPDFVVILPWNLREEITRQISYVTEWGGRFATAVPALETWP
jgi:predicted TPR repeat methyltransferase